MSDRSASQLKPSAFWVPADLPLKHVAGALLTWTDPANLLELDRVVEDLLKEIQLVVLSIRHEVIAVRNQINVTLWVVIDVRDALQRDEPGVTQHVSNQLSEQPARLACAVERSSEHQEITVASQLLRWHHHRGLVHQSV